MLKDRTIIWALEYVMGGTLVLVPLGILALGQDSSAKDYVWATGLFVVSLGVILISCASSMRQRMLLAKRIDALDKKIAAFIKES